MDQKDFSGPVWGRRDEFNHVSDLSVNSAHSSTLLLPHLSLSLFLRNLETVEKKRSSNTGEGGVSVRV